jgi:precorrin-4 methylase
VHGRERLFVRRVLPDMRSAPMLTGDNAIRGARHERTERMTESAAGYEAETPEGVVAMWAAATLDTLEDSGGGAAC